MRASIHSSLRDLLARNPIATSSESYVQHHVEFVLLREQRNPHYTLRIGINYHGAKVQHVTLDRRGRLIGWNRNGDALGTGARAKLRLAGQTIFPRDPDEQLMSDSKVGGGDVPPGRFVRIEFKVRGWLGKTRNLDGIQLEKDIDLLKNDRADLLVICLSETAHLKWRGEGPLHQANRRVGTARIAQILSDPVTVGAQALSRNFTFEGQRWASSTERVVGSNASVMPGAIHYVTLVWRRATRITPDIAPTP
ncbi:hypothetical protein [Nocardioides sp.]|uniref:hypothetical protein n=1 Tax=Nocardioides sp. TaxID=35761 RepID=UPI0025E2B554|nr:hypothetical protein [Nocardioides sp.]